MPVKPHARRVVKWLVVAILLASHAATDGAIAAEIPWKGSALFKRYSHDEDIKDVLRNVLRNNGLAVVFGKGVKGTITYKFERVPLQGVFNMLIAQNELAYIYDAADKTVIIYREGAKPPPRKKKKRPKQVRGFAAIKHTDGKKLIAEVRRLGMGGKITLAAEGKTAVIRGTRDQVRKIKQLIRTREAAARARIAKRKAEARAGLAKKAEAKRQAGLARKAEAGRKARLARKAEAERQARLAEERALASEAERVRKLVAERRAELARRAEARRQAKLAKEQVAALRAELAAKQKAAARKAEAARQAKLAEESAALRRAALEKETAAKRVAVRATPTPSPAVTPMAMPAEEQAAPEIDLTFLYKLSGIGMVGRGSRVAILNGKDYRVGDEIDGLRIAEIQSDQVRLAKLTDNGVERYLVRFRKAKKVQTTAKVRKVTARKPVPVVSTLPTVDLTAEYRLSGIGQIGSGSRFAVLDGTDYRVGDTLSGMRIVDIASDSVRLVKPTPYGNRSYVVRFRIKKK